VSALDMQGFPVQKTHIITSTAANVLAVTRWCHRLGSHRAM